MGDDVDPPNRYFVTTDGRGEREVDEAEDVRVEQGAGFHGKSGQARHATASFGSTMSGTSGRVTYGWGKKGEGS